MRIIMTLMAFVLTIAMQAQDDITDLVATFLAAQLHQDSIDVSDIVVVYKYTCKTFDADNQPVIDSTRMVLQVGKHSTRFYPYHKYMEDTQGVDYFTPENYTTVQADALCHLPEVCTNYPEGKMTVRDIIPPSHYESREDLQKLIWTVREQDTVTVKGYRCKTARCGLNGTGWTVRFTEDIPVVAGPWKLCGLPGLILEAESRDGIHYFVMEELKNVKTPIYYEHNAITKKIDEKKLIGQRNNIFGNKPYLNNPMYYTDVRELSFTEDMIYYENGSGEGSWIINGTFVGPKAHVFQPLENW